MDLAKAFKLSGALRVGNQIKVAKHFAASGGLNVMDSPLDIPPSELIGCLNYDPSIIAGYTRSQGYERFDGHASPSDANYVVVSYALTTGFNPVQGNVVTESGSGASATIAYVDTVNLTLVMVAVTGTFVGNGSTLTIAAHTALTTSPAYFDQASTPSLSSTYFYQKFLYLQGFIGPVGGAACSGPVRGAWMYLKHIYAFRNSADGTHGMMFVDSPSGWTAVPLGIKVAFNAGVYHDGAMNPIPEGSLLTGATSAATFTVKRVLSASGTWGIDAAGSFIVSAITGTPVAGELLKLAGVTAATYLSNAAQTLAPNGTYYFRNWNFDAAQNPASGYRMYATNGVNKGFEFDAYSNTFALIDTGMPTDTPDMLDIHANYLFFGFPGGSLQNSGFQLPLNWNPVFGADERSVGDDITFMREDVSQTLNIATRRNIWQLTGLQTEQFQLRIYSTNNGAIPLTDEMPGQIVYAEDRGVTTVAASAQFGDFSAGALTNKILDLIAASINTDTPVGATLTRQKNLYRLIFASGLCYNLAINAGGKFTGWTTTNLVHAPSCVSCGLFGDDSMPNYERAFIGCVDGYVREMEKGISFDGQIVNHFLKFAYYHMGSPDYFKRIRRVQIDLHATGPASVFVGCDCDYGVRSGQVSLAMQLLSGGAFWDVGVWDQFTWDSVVYQPIALKLDLEGYNVSLTLSGGNITDAPFTVSGVSYQYTPRIINRNTQE